MRYVKILGSKEGVIKHNLKMMVGKKSGYMEKEVSMESFGGNAGFTKDGRPCAGANFIYDQRGRIMEFGNIQNISNRKLVRKTKTGGFEIQKGYKGGIFKIALDFKTGIYQIVGLFDWGARLFRKRSDMPKNIYNLLRKCANRYNKKYKESLENQKEKVHVST